ncbi:condensation domain-containing protein [Dactylosporangium sp. CA-233914]|uniref:condensation domain-containing protein n=1 Tax=Dactylosporangium sp. CA-233914 TaxID=3239934 RepID=UPI003D9275DA
MYLAPSSTSIAFRTDRTGEGPLIWAQLAIWDVLRWLPAGDTTLNLLVHAPVPAGRGLVAVSEAVRLLVERHDALRTVFFERDGEPVQKVLGSGEIPLHLHELPDDVSLGEAVTEIGERLRKPWFDIGRDLPLRAAVLLRDGVPQLVLLAASHMAVDGWSFGIVRGGPREPARRSAGRARGGAAAAGAGAVRAVRGRPAAGGQRAGVLGAAPADAAGRHARTGAALGRAAEPRLGGLRELLPATKLRSPVIDRLPKHANFFMFLMDLGETAELMLSVELGFFGRRGPLGFLADLERVVVRAASDGTSTTADLYSAVR